MTKKELIDALNACCAEDDTEVNIRTEDDSYIEVKSVYIDDEDFIVWIDTVA